MGTNWLSIQAHHVISAQKNDARTCFSVLEMSKPKKTTSTRIDDGAS